MHPYRLHSYIGMHMYHPQSQPCTCNTTSLVRLLCKAASLHCVAMLLYLMSLRTVEHLNRPDLHGSNIIYGQVARQTIPQTPNTTTTCKALSSIVMLWPLRGLLQYEL